MVDTVNSSAGPRRPRGRQVPAARVPAGRPRLTSGGAGLPLRRRPASPILSFSTGEYDARSTADGPVGRGRRATHVTIYARWQAWPAGRRAARRVPRRAGVDAGGWRPAAARHASDAARRRRTACGGPRHGRRRRGVAVGAARPERTTARASAPRQPRGAPALAARRTGRPAGRALVRRVRAGRWRVGAHLPAAADGLGGRRSRTSSSRPTSGTACGRARCPALARIRAPPRRPDDLRQPRRVHAVAGLRRARVADPRLSSPRLERRWAHRVDRVLTVNEPYADLIARQLGSHGRPS